MAAPAALPGPGKLTECQCVGGVWRELGDVALELNTELRSDVVTLESSVPGEVLDCLRMRAALRGAGAAPAVDSARVSRGPGADLWREAQADLGRRSLSLIDMVVE